MCQRTLPRNTFGNLDVWKSVQPDCTHAPGERLTVTCKAGPYSIARCRRGPAATAAAAMTRCHTIYHAWREPIEAEGRRHEVEPLAAQAVRGGVVTDLVEEGPADTTASSGWRSQLGETQR
jgi:hypothetical protein